MSFKDLRNLCEILRAVGYPRLVSIENFRSPNFPLVADISRWLVLQYEPKAELPLSTDTEGDRVNLVRTFAEFMLINVQVKLNTKRLYQADGYAVKELLKVASVLYGAVREAEQSVSKSGPYKKPLPDHEHGRIEVKELQEARSLSSSLIKKGVGLYELLGKEGAVRDARNQALSKAHEHTEVERIIKSAIDTAAQEIKKMSTILETAQNNCSSLSTKIEDKSMELERSQKRLQTLKKVRPAFMDEYEELQEEMGMVYQEYVHRFRALAFLRNRIEEMERTEQERKMEERLSKAEMGRRGILAGDDLLLSYGNGKGLGGGGAFFGSSGSEDSSDELSMGNNNNNKNIKALVPPSTTGSSSRSGRSGGGGGMRARVGGKPSSNMESTSLINGKGGLYGDMMGDSEDESDMILVDGDNDDEFGTDEEEDELEAMRREQVAASEGVRRDKVGELKMRSRPNGSNNKHGEKKFIANGGITGGLKPPKPPPTSDDEF